MAKNGAECVATLRDTASCAPSKSSSGSELLTAAETMATTHTHTHKQDGAAAGIGRMLQEWPLSFRP